MTGQRDQTLVALERQIRTSIRDAVNRRSRKPFYWGGLKGYEQLQAIAQVLNEVPDDGPETTYLRRLAMQVNRVVDKNRIQAQDLQEAHRVCQIECVNEMPDGKELSIGS